MTVETAVDDNKAMDISLGFESMNPNHRVEIEDVDLDDMFIDPRLQRGEEPGEIAEIISRFNEGALGTLTVSLREDNPSGGSYSVLDGQQRRAVLLRLREMGRWAEGKKVKVLVHYGLSLKEEAQLFLDLNYRRSVNPLRRFKTRILAEEPVAIQIRDILDGFDIPLGSVPKGFQAVNTAERILRQDGGEDRLRWSLNMIKNIYDMGDGGCWDGRVIEGFALVHAAYITQLDEPRLIKKLTSVGNHISKLLGAGRTRQGIFNGQIAFHIGEAIIDFYNKSNRSNPKFPRSLPALPRRKLATLMATDSGEDR